MDEDTRRSMAVYRDGDDLQDRIRESSFTADGKRLNPKAPHCHVDLNERLHERLFYYNKHFIPIRFYAKWLESLNFYLDQPERSPTTKSVSMDSQLNYCTPVPTPLRHSSSPIAPSSAATPVPASMQALTEKRIEQQSSMTGKMIS